MGKRIFLILAVELPACGGSRVKARGRKIEQHNCLQ